MAFHCFIPRISDKICHGALFGVLVFFSLSGDNKQLGVLVKYRFSSQVLCLLRGGNYIYGFSCVYIYTVSEHDLHLWELWTGGLLRTCKELDRRSISRFYVDV